MCNKVSLVPHSLLETQKTQCSNNHHHQPHCTHEENMQQTKKQKQVKTDKEGKQKPVKPKDFSMTNTFEMEIEDYQTEEHQKMQAMNIEQLVEFIESKANHNKQGKKKSSKKGKKQKPEEKQFDAGRDDENKTGKKTNRADSLSNC